MTEIKPCPECGSDNLNIQTEHISGRRVIYCVDCNKYYDQLELTREDTRSDILEKWNEYAENYKPEPKTEPALKPCPFCGGQAHRMFGPEVWIECTECQASSCMHCNIETAEDDWHRRVVE